MTDTQTKIYTPKKGDTVWVWNQGELRQVVVESYEDFGHSMVAVSKGFAYTHCYQTKPEAVVAMAKILARRVKSFCKSIPKIPSELKDEIIKAADSLISLESKLHEDE